MKRFWGVLLALAMLFSLGTAAFAAVEDTGFSDVAEDAWYAEAVAYVKENGLMSGVSDTTFSPGASMSRAMLATVLYRANGSPAVSGTGNFSDVSAGAYYHDAAVWASENGIMSGYGGGSFGGDDPVTREQIAAILWRYAGSPAADAGQDFADESEIAAYAADAVDWARATGVMNGKETNRFDPKGNATRAEVAAMLHNYMTLGTPEAPDESGKSLVVYFSMPETSDPDDMTTEEANSTVVIDDEVLGNTQYVAYVIREYTGADIFRIEPVTPYPTDHETLVALALEEQNSSARPAIARQVENMEQYDTIFIGYPNWWGDMPMILYSFFDTYDLSGKTIIPFNTHGGSGFSSTIHTIGELEPGAAVVEDGFTVSRNHVQEAELDIRTWLAGLGFSK